jgi:hypothetical protein
LDAAGGQDKKRGHIEMGGANKTVRIRLYLFPFLLEKRSKSE